MQDEEDIQDRLELAVEEADAEAVRQALAQGADPNARRRGVGSRVDNPPLFWAAFGERLEIARILLEGGARVAAELPYDSTSVHEAAERGNLAMLDLLLQWDGGVALNHFDYVHRTPLMCAIDLGDARVVERLIEAGSDVNAYNESRIGDTALFRAAKHSSVEIIELLLRAGADPSLICWMQQNAVHHAELRSGEDRDQVIALLRAAWPPRSDE